ncbi:hypothetical protein SteCoe_10354 [Stentor coeruleus]|uniref:Uncharacterized protein n=1 Tax=Stentor coeruleus TaxID=5963 RepID=A0A1R2CFS0_9CILI|nr:hypothetical protein SteCoe_10354 [Stentor coeruleus]
MTSKNLFDFFIIFEMGCCQSGSLSSEIEFEENNSELISSFKPIHFILIPGETNQKFEPTPSFGSGSKNFAFDSSHERENLEIN